MNAELAKMQGIWNIETLEVEGATMSSEACKGSQIVVSGDTFTTIEMGAKHNGTLKVDDTRTPKTFDLMFSEGPHAGNVSLALYELDGDNWKICLSFAGGVRPREFATSVGSRHALETLKRQTRETREQANPLLTIATQNELQLRCPPELLEFQGEWVMVSGTQNGEPFPAAFIASGRRVVRGNQTTVSFGTQVFLKATLTVNPSSEPRTIDYLISSGPQKGQIIRGIYECDADTTHLCFSAIGANRPTEFISEPGLQRTLTVWKRANNWLGSSATRATQNSSTKHS